MSCPTDSCRKGAKCLDCMERDGRTLPPKLYANEAQILWSAGGTVAYDFTVPADPHNIHRDKP